MELYPRGANCNEVVLGNRSVLFSYKTPVAVHIEGVGYFKTEKKWSRTTSRHINAFLNGSEAQEKPQSFFDELVK